MILFLVHAYDARWAVSGVEGGYLLTLSTLCIVVEARMRRARNKYIDKRKRTWKSKGRISTGYLTKTIHAGRHKEKCLV